MGFNIAIDGPASAGKSTLAKRLAKELGFIYVDTGAFYRALALYFVNQKMDLNNEEEISNGCKDVNVEIGFVEGMQQIFLNGENVTNDLRSEEVGEAASITSQYKEVRKKLLDMQRDIALKENVIMDGRDIGTVVLPNADLKIFLTADVHTRSKRRYAELVEKGMDISFEEVEEDLISRDYRDTNRKESPLLQASDAIAIDTTDITLDEEIKIIRKLYNKKGSN